MPADPDNKSIAATRADSQCSGILEVEDVLVEDAQVADALVAAVAADRRGRQ